MQIVGGALRFFTERFGGRPFNNCLLLAIMVVLRWMGYYVMDGDDDRIRTLTGVPDYDAKGEAQGLRIGQAVKGVRAFLSAAFAPPDVVHLSDADFINGLKLVGARGRNKACYAVVVNNTGKLPPHFQRLVGQNYDAGHAFAVVATTSHVMIPAALETVQVYILDPMGKTSPDLNDPTPQDFEPYVGELIPWSDFGPALDRDDAGLIICVRGYKNSAGVAATP